VNAVLAAAALAFLAAMALTGAQPVQRQLAAYEPKGVLKIPPDRIRRVRLGRGAEWVTLVRTGEKTWATLDGLDIGDAGERISVAVQMMHTSGPARVMASEELAGVALAEFELDAPIVEAMLYDADVSLRSSAHSALTALNYRPGKDSWTVDLDAAAVKTYVDLFQQDPEPFIRAKTVQLFTLCQCNESTTEARKQLFREAIYDTDPTVVRISIRGAADLKIADMVPRIVQLLDDDDEDTRHNAATAIQVYGRDAGRFSNELRAALAKEKNAEIREILKYSLQGIE